MEKLIVKGGKQLRGETTVSGAKNVVLKALVAACLTDEKVTITNIPFISDLIVMTDIIKHLGGDVRFGDHVISVRVKNIKTDTIDLETAAEIRTSFMFLAPLLARKKSAVIPNPGGCRIGARPIDRIVDGLKKMNVSIKYVSRDGYFHAFTTGLEGARYKFSKNTHTGTETLILAAVLAKGRTILENAAEEPEIDELIGFLNKMGAKIKREKRRTILIDGVKKLSGAKLSIGYDRNEVVTLAVAAILTEGDIFIKGIKKNGLSEFLDKLKEIGGGYEEKKNGIRFFYKNQLSSGKVTTAPYPAFMTDWQGPWAVLMTKAKGSSVIHETVYENRFTYLNELEKMGGEFELFNPKIKNPKKLYNFDTEEDGQYHAIRIKGPVELHNGVVNISDLRAGATLVLGALSAKGESVIFGVEHLDRGYEQLDLRLRKLGADIQRVSYE